MYIRPTSRVKCSICEKQFEKENRKINKTIREGGVHCCSKKCASINASNIKKIPLSYNLNNARKLAKVKSLEFDLDIDYLQLLHKEQYGKCAISNVDLVLKFAKGTREINQVSIDRIDNSKGYIKGNVQLVCLGINYLRKTFEISEVMNLLKQISVQLDKQPS